MTGRRFLHGLAGLALLTGACGCGTTRATDTTRAASEMLLVSQAVDNAIGQLDFTALDGKTVFLDTAYLDGTVDKGYLVSSLRQHLLAHGALLQETREKATYVVEPRTGGVGTDRHSLLVGTPAVTIPSVAPIPVPGASIPEIALVKKTEQKGVAKLAVFAYNRETGRAVWQSGLVDATSTLKDTWVFGAGPFSRGSIRDRTELAGEPLPHLPLPFASAEGPVKPVGAQTYPNGDARPIPPIPPDPSPPVAPAGGPPGKR